MSVRNITIGDPDIFLSILNRTKRVEGRLYDEKRKAFKVGDIMLINGISGVISTVITNIHHYDTLKEYIMKEGIKNVLPNVASLEDAMNVYYSFFSQEDIQKYGFIAIHFLVKEYIPLVELKIYNSLLFIERILELDIATDDRPRKFIGKMPSVIELHNVYTNGMSTYGKGEIEILDFWVETNHGLNPTLRVHCGFVDNYDGKNTYAYLTIPIEFIKDIKSFDDLVNVVLRN